MPHPRPAGGRPFPSSLTFRPNAYASVPPAANPVLPPGPASSAAGRRGRPPTEATSGPPATYRSATGLIALRRCARDQRPGPGGGKQKRGQAREQVRQRAPRSPELASQADRTPLARPPLRPRGLGAGSRCQGAGPRCQGRGHARPAAQLIGRKLASVSVELPTQSASGRFTPAIAD